MDYYREGNKLLGYCPTLRRWWGFLTHQVDISLLLGSLLLFFAWEDGKPGWTEALQDWVQLLRVLLTCVCVCTDPASHFHPEEVHVWKTHPGQAGKVLYEEWC